MPQPITTIIPDMNAEHPMIEHLSKTPPTCLDSQTSPYFYKTYQEKLTGKAQLDENLLMNGMAQFVFGKDLTATDIMGFPVNPLTLATNVKLMQTEYLLSHAFLFALTGLGNCSHRSAYAAIQLFAYLKDTDTKIGSSDNCVGSLAKSS